jgi:hypothetical protein
MNYKTQPLECGYLLRDDGVKVYPDTPEYAEYVVWVNAGNTPEIWDEGWRPIIIRRNELLLQSDWTQLQDTVLTNDEKIAWAEYRQNLRNIPQDFSNPQEVVFPEVP